MSHQSYWRSRARERIIQVIEHYLETNGKGTDGMHWLSTIVATKLSSQEIKELKSQISRAYPFGARKYYPYQIWRAEVKAQIQMLEGQAITANGYKQSNMKTAFCPCYTRATQFVWRDLNWSSSMGSLLP